jgi:hypothetical protein
VRRHPIRSWSPVFALGVLAACAAIACTAAAARSSGRPTAAAVTAGIEHTCALTRTGAVKCWGYNGHDELGVGAGSSELPFSFIPRGVSGLTGGVTAISAGVRHSCALTSGGGVKCWGVNYGGALGDGTEDRHFAPVDVAGLSTGVKAVVAGYDRSCAVLETGAVKCWGTDYGLTPVDVPGLSSGVVAVDTDSFIGCALTGAGGVKCWGFHYGPTAVDVPGLANGVKAVTTGGPLCALTTGGAVKCWGPDNNWMPADVPGLGSGRGCACHGYRPRLRALEDRRGQVLGLERTGGARRRDDDRPRHTGERRRTESRYDRDRRGGLPQLRRERHGCRQVLGRQRERRPRRRIDHPPPSARRRLRLWSTSGPMRRAEHRWQAACDRAGQDPARPLPCGNDREGRRGKIEERRRRPEPARGEEAQSRVARQPEAEPRRLITLRAGDVRP